MARRLGLCEAPFGYQEGGLVPVSDELLADVEPWHRVVDAYLNRGLARILTAGIYGEDWHDVEGEMQRLETGRVYQWDSWLEDEEDED